MSKNPKKKLGERIRTFRKQVGWSQEELAEACGLHRTYVGAVEHGERNIGLVNIVQIARSLKAKTSSNPNHIFGNRSYAQATTTNKKAKTGYYLAVNFQKFSADVKRPNILLVRFGWLDSTDWIGQKAATGQQSRLSPDVESYKLIEIYKHT